MTLRLTVTLKIPPLPLFSPTQSRAILTQEVSAGVFSLVEQIATEARARTPVGVSGLGRASIATRVVSGVSARVLVEGTVFTGAQASYMLPLEEGSRPHWPPRAPIELWAERVLGDKRLWFVVARAISRRGTRARHMFRDSLAAVRPRVVPTLQAAVDRAVRILGGR